MNTTRFSLIICLICALMIVLTLLSFSSSGQPYMDFGGGISNTGAPVMKISAGYQFANNVVAEGIIQPSIARKVDAPNYFGVKGGYNYRGFTPSIAALYNYRSADDVTVNGWQVGYALKYQYPLNECGGLYAEALYTKSSYSITTGFNIQF